MKTRKGQKRQVKGKKPKAGGRDVTAARREDPCERRLHMKAGCRGRRPGRLRAPPPESDVWPPQYRGERWKRVYGMLFEGKCLLCRYGFSQPASRQKRDRWLRQDTPLLCTNHAACPGEMIEVLATDTCRNFKARYWRYPRKKPEGVTPALWPPKGKKGVRRVPLSQGLFATVDAADYKKISRHKWSVCRQGCKVYAKTRINGRIVLMHRFLMRPRKGYHVDHIDGNGLNNCRNNLRICTAAQNQVNRGPRGGSSRFVGVYRHKDRWRAGIAYRGRWYALGTYADEVEAAKARDRKAVELHGVYAYLNFPEDWTFDKNGVGHPVRATAKRRWR
jgi:hypothetical protein